MSWASKATNVLWKTATTATFALSAVLTVVAFTRAAKFGANWEEWKAYQKMREEIAKEIVSEEIDKDVELEQILGLKPREQ